jgi:hypothetical protein
VYLGSILFLSTVHFCACRQFTLVSECSLIWKFALSTHIYFIFCDAASYLFQRIILWSSYLFVRKFGSYVCKFPLLLRFLLILFLEAHFTYVWKFSMYVCKHVKFSLRFELCMLVPCADVLPLKISNASTCIFFLNIQEQTKFGIQNYKTIHYILKPNMSLLLRLLLFDIQNIEVHLREIEQKQRSLKFHTWYILSCS